MEMSPIVTSRLGAKGATLAYADRTIVDKIDVSIPDGRITVIVGPNGCGKSTLLRALARLMTPRQGSVLLDGKDIHALPTREVARRLGLLPQAPISPEGILVGDLVARGRSPHQSAFQQWSREDEAAVEEALAATGLAEVADRRVDELSGGQRQRVWIAMALAQHTSLLLLDEPTTFLDLRHQIDVLGLLRKLNRNEGRTLVLVLHDINLACRYADHIIAMRDGCIIAEGPPSTVVTAQTMADVFGLDCTVIPDPAAGTPLIIPAVE
jgi:iron complex transport system ATP-binding protein